MTKVENVLVEYTHDADGLRVYPGDTVWVNSPNTGWYSAIVNQCYKFKVSFVSPRGKHGYTGARFNIIHIQAPWGQDDCIRET